MIFQKQLIIVKVVADRKLYQFLWTIVLKFIYHTCLLGVLLQTQWKPFSRNEVCLKSAVYSKYFLMFWKLRQNSVTRTVSKALTRYRKALFKLDLLKIAPKFYRKNFLTKTTTPRDIKYVITFRVKKRSGFATYATQTPFFSRRQRLKQKLINHWHHEELGRTYQKNNRGKKLKI